MNDATTSNFQLTTTATYSFPCPACGHAIEGMTARWCLCLVKRPSVVCDRCQTCLCKSEPHVARSFWSGAPAALVERYFLERSHRLAQSKIVVEPVDILVVDDDEEICTAAGYMLQEMGYRVATAPAGSEALELIEKVTPLLVLTDALMPKMDGRQLCRFIKASYPDIRVVIMTSLYTAPRYKYEAFKTFRADDYVAKPIDFAQLSAVVRRLVLPRSQAVA